MKLNSPIPLQETRAAYIKAYKQRRKSAAYFGAKPAQFSAQISQSL